MTIEKALKVASSAHKSQLRKIGKIPYILHPLEAAVITSNL